ncbi:MAG TPA: S53 family peptidase [Rhizomicrobium sp.]|jgi:kumamolisin
MAKFRKMLLLAGAATVAIVSSAAIGAAPSYVPLERSVIPLTKDVKVLGAADSLAVVHFQVALAIRDLDGLTASNQRNIVLTPAELSAKYLPTQENYNALLQWLREAGLSVDKTTKSRLAVQVSGHVAEVTRALKVHFSHIQAEGVDMVSADTAPAIPAKLANIVLSINGLQPQQKAHTMHVIKPLLAKEPLSSNAPPYFPKAFLTGYAAAGEGKAGVTSTTAIVIDTFPNPLDVNQFWIATGTPQSIGNISLILTFPDLLPLPSGEESMDVETSSSIAPKSKVRVYASTSLAFAKLDTAFEAVADDLIDGVRIDQMSVSIGGCESTVGVGQLNTDESLFAAITALGASIFISSGDSGSDECKNNTAVPSYYSTSPNVTAVGGTSLLLNSNGTWKKEIAWSGSGGGVSTVFARPSYQSAINSNARVVPDVAADADPNTGALVRVNGAYQQIGGTSLSAPIWAGLSALINAKRREEKKHTMGLVNSRVYPLLRTTNFHDITAGNNGAFKATVGYDAVTGIGSPSMAVLFNTLINQN